MLGHCHPDRRTRSQPLILVSVFQDDDLLLSLGVQPPVPGLPQRPQLRLAAGQRAPAHIRPRPEAAPHHPGLAGQPRAPEDGGDITLQVTQRQ